MKRWCCPFTCLTTRAVHVEDVPSLEADACFAAITRFIVIMEQILWARLENGENG